MLEKEGYPPIALKHDAKQDYKKSLEEWQVRGNPKMFLDVVKKLCFRWTAGKNSYNNSYKRNNESIKYGLELWEQQRADGIRWWFRNIME